MNASPLEIERVLTLIALEAKSTLGKNAIARRRPLRTLQECEAAQADLAEMVRFFHRDGLLPLAGLTDVEAAKGGYSWPDEVVPLPSPIRSSRSAKSNNSCWISAILVCRASCLIFSAIA